MDGGRKMDWKRKVRRDKKRGTDEKMQPEENNIENGGGRGWDEGKREVKGWKDAETEKKASSGRGD